MPPSRRAARLGRLHAYYRQRHKTGHYKQVKDNAKRYWSCNRAIFNARMRACLTCGVSVDCDACSLPDGSNALLPSYCSPARSFLRGTHKHLGFWINPPFHRAKKFIEAAARHAKENANVILILPDWPDRPWFKQAQMQFTKVHTFHAGTMLFERQNIGPGPMHRYCAPCPWPVSIYAKCIAKNELQLSEQLKSAFWALVQQTGVQSEMQNLECTAEHM